MTMIQADINVSLSEACHEVRDDWETNGTVIQVRWHDPKGKLIHFYRCNDKIYRNTKNSPFQKLDKITYQMSKRRFQSSGSFWSNEESELPREQSENLRVQREMKRLMFDKEHPIMDCQALQFDQLMEVPDLSGIVAVTPATNTRCVNCGENPYRKKPNDHRSDHRSDHSDDSDESQEKFSCWWIILIVIIFLAAAAAFFMMSKKPEQKRLPVKQPACPPQPVAPATPEPVVYMYDAQPMAYEPVYEQTTTLYEPVYETQPLCDNAPYEPVYTVQPTYGATSPYGTTSPNEINVIIQ